MESNAHQFDDEHWNYDNLNFHVYTCTKSYKFNGYVGTSYVTGYTGVPIDYNWHYVSVDGTGGTYDWGTGHGDMPEKIYPPITDNLMFEWQGGSATFTELAAASDSPDTGLPFLGSITPNSIRIVDQPGTPDATKFKLLPHHVLTGWTHARSTEDSIQRCFIMWSPFYKSTEGSGIEHAHPFKGFYRTVTAVPIQLPGFDTYGFLSHESDFGYMMLKRIYGISEHSGPSGKVSKFHPLRDRDFNNPDALLGYSPGQNYDGNIPSRQTYTSFLEEYWRPEYSSDYMVTVPEPVHKAYGGFARVPFVIKLGFTYDTAGQSFGTFETGTASRTMHPSNDYLRNKTETIIRNEESAGVDDDDKTNTLIEEYVRLTNLFASRVEDFAYHLVCAKGGRLSPSGGWIEADAADVHRDNDFSPFSSYDHDAGLVPFSMPYLRAKKVDAASTDTITHKMRYPRPYDGEELRQHLGFDAFYSGDSTTWPNVTLTSTDDFDASAGDETLGKMQDQCFNASLQNRFLMFWGPIAHSARGLQAHNRDYREKLLYYGDPAIIGMFAWLRFQSYVSNLSKLWVYDDTPKEARIRMQKMPEYKMDIFSSISDGSEDYQDSLDYAEFVSKEMADNRIREFGFTPTEEDVADVEARTGRDYSHRLTGD